MNIMKRILLYTLTCFFIAGCSLDNYKPLDTYSDVTEGRAEEEQAGGEQSAFSSKQDVDSYMTGMYKLLRDRQEHACVDRLLLAEAHSDNAYGGTTGAEVVPYENNSIEGSNSVNERDWSRYQADIAYTNLLINEIDKVSDPALTPSQRESYKMQAKIFRAMILFQMARTWGNVPIVTSVAGKITSETIADVYDDYFPEQHTQEEAFRQVEKDLLNAVASKDTPRNNPADKTKFTTAVANALLAKLYAEPAIRDYAKVIQYADAVAAEGLDLDADFSNLFGMNDEQTDVKMRNSVETILEAHFGPGSGNWATWMFGRNLVNWDENFSWAKWVTPSRDLIRAFKRMGDTTRFQETIVYYETTWSNYYPTNSYPFMYKLRSAYSSLIYLRYADILLLKAEAYLYGDNTDISKAVEIINRIRSRANLKPLDSSMVGSLEDVRRAYLQERRLELAMEGERWFDLVRLGLVEEVMNGINTRDEGRKTLAQPYSSTSYFLPIPQSAIDANEKLVQNPGY